MLERGYTMHHAISQDKQGNILATVSKTSAKIANGKDVRINDFIIMMDPEKGDIARMGFGAHVGFGSLWNDRL